MRKNAEKLFSEKFADLANIAAGSLIFGQIVRPEKFDTNVAIFGLVIVVYLYFMSYSLSIKEEDY